MLARPSRETPTPLFDHGAKPLNRAVHRQQLCAEMCEGSIHFGTQWSEECWCGPEGEDADYGKHGVSTACDQPCTGDSDEMCGGDLEMSVYQYGGFAITGELVGTAMGRVPQVPQVDRQRS